MIMARWVLMGRVRGIFAVLFLLAPLLVAPTSAVAAGPAYHVVRPGQTILKIARVYGVTPAQLRAWNGLVAPHQPVADGVLHVRKPAVALTGWRTRVERVTAAEVGWDPAAKCPVKPADLRKVWVTYIDFYGVAHPGSLVVHRKVTGSVQSAFRALYRMRFRIQAMQPVAVNAPRLADPEAITRAYECRTVAGSSTISQHAYGLAIDVNPVQNPMVRGSYVDPPAGTAFLERAPFRRGMIHRGGAERAFTRHGFPWGGRWRTLKDYMHFSTTNR